jgi:hypothetical protein
MDEPTSPPRVQVGTCVVIELIARSGEREALTFDLVPDAQADYQAGFLGVSAPLARAILGETAGVAVPYFTEDLLGVQICAVTPSTRQPAPDSAARRDAAVRDAVSQIEFTNAVLFAASVDTKWGEYDADGLDFEQWKARQPGQDEASAEK